MEASTINVIIAGIIGLFTGAIGSLVAPWANWGIEKKRIKHERRIKLIQTWRGIISEENFDRYKFIEDPIYGPLRELLSEKVRENMGRPENEIHVTMGHLSQNQDKIALQKEITRIEKEWGII